MEYKYNKKNNTYFLYEMLVRKYVDLYEKSVPKREILLRFIVNTFNVKTLLGKERKLYEQIVFLKDTNLTKEEMLYVLRKCRDDYIVLNKDNTKKLRESTIRKVRIILNDDSDSFLNEKIDDYKFLANIYHYFNSSDYSVSVLMERKILDDIMKQKKTNKIVNEKKGVIIDIDKKNVVLDQDFEFLLNENNPGAVLYLYDSVERFKEILLKHSVCSECEVCDVDMKSGILKIYHRLEEFKNREITKQDYEFLSDIAKLVEQLEGGS